ncbi:MAG: protein phosphatase 2C domain-containing protein [Akkermansiaceae bacterium]|nr:protein phosphatase 2C domain-containing protein [Akkermansiaceae bacterium]
MQNIETTSFSHVGTREEQQDSVGMWSNDRSHLIVVADGVGGNVGGAAASQAAIQCAKDYWQMHDGVFPAPEDDLTAIAQLSHDAIRELHPNERRTPSSTLVALYLDTDKKEAHWVHMGDSRLYRINNGKSITRTLDHSIVQLLLQQGEITEDELNSHPDKGRILKSLGASTFKGVDYDSCTYSPRDTFLLCSDGYWESLGPNDKPLPPIATGMTMEQYARKIVMDAVARNGEKSDNTTVAIAFIPQTDQSDSPPSSNLKWNLTAILLILIALVDVAIILCYFLSPEQ